LGWTALIGMVVVLCSYFIYMPAQREVESRFASQLARRLQWYPLEFTNTVVTNLAQVLYDVHGGYPYGWHEWFRIYGSDAGFTHSLAEKYVLTQPGVFLRGEVYLISAQPFMEKGRQHRIVIYNQTYGFGSDSISERRIQEAFQNAGKEIPMPVTTGTPPLPPSSTIRNVRPYSYYMSAWLETRGSFSQLEWKGLSPWTARAIEQIVAWGLSVIGVLFIGYCLWPVPAMNRNEEVPLVAPMTTTQKIWSMIVGTMAFFVVLGFMLPALGSDRGYGQLLLHLVLPYLAAWEWLPVQKSAWPLIRGILFFGQIAVYAVFMCLAWIRNRLGLAMIALSAIHLFFVAISIWVFLNRR